MNQLLAELAKERRQRGIKRSYESVSEKQDNEESSLCKSWACSRCTFLNTINPNICEICHGPNPLSETFSTVLPMLHEHSNGSGGGGGRGGGRGGGGRRLSSGRMREGELVTLQSSEPAWNVDGSSSDQLVEGS